MKFSRIIFIFVITTVAFANEAHVLTRLESCSRIASEEVFYSSDTQAKMVVVSGVVCGVNPNGQQCQIFQYHPTVEMNWLTDRMDDRVKYMRWGETAEFNGTIFGCGIGQ